MGTNFEREMVYLVSFSGDYDGRAFHGFRGLPARGRTMTACPLLFERANFGFVLNTLANFYVDPLLFFVGLFEFCFLHFGFPIAFMVVWYVYHCH